MAERLSDNGDVVDDREGAAAEGKLCFAPLAFCFSCETSFVSDRRSSSFPFSVCCPLLFFSFYFLSVFCPSSSHPFVHRLFTRILLHIAFSHRQNLSLFLCLSSLLSFSFPFPLQKNFSIRTFAFYTPAVISIFLSASLFLLSPFSFSFSEKQSPVLTTALMH